MTELRTDLNAAQKDYALFLPAISSFYGLYIGKQMSDPNYIPQERMPDQIPEMEMINFLNQDKGLFKYKWGLYSAGHAQLDLTRDVPRENMIRKRDQKRTLLLADSGGFQIGKGVWAANWLDPNDKEAEKYRSKVLTWLCQISDYSMCLDIPTWACKTDAADKINIHSFEDSMTATQYNHEYFMKNATGNVKFLNVLQGENHSEADKWYEAMKEYCDPKKHDNPFRGWAMGGANMADPHLALKRIVTLIHEGLLEEGQQDWMHFLGTSKLEWAAFLTAIQRAVRRTHNKNFTISFDCASPFLATANGRLYTYIQYPHLGKWAYQMEFTVDDKKYAKDQRSFKEVVTNEISHKHKNIIHPRFDDSPISERLKISDICVYSPGEVNKIGKEGRTSWDSFSYTLLMAHNVWHHINAVQEANRLVDSGTLPAMLYDPINGISHEDIINAVFSTDDYEERLEIIDSFSKFWMKFSGARGLGGKKAINAATQFDAMFELDIEEAIRKEEERLAEEEGIEAKPIPKVADEVVTSLFDFGD